LWFICSSSKDKAIRFYRETEKLIWATELEVATRFLKEGSKGNNYQ